MSGAIKTLENFSTNRMFLNAIKDKLQTRKEFIVYVIPNHYLLGYTYCFKFHKEDYLIFKLEESIPQLEKEISSILTNLVRNAFDGYFENYIQINVKFTV